MRGVVAPLVKLVTFALVTVIATGFLAIAIANVGAGGNNDFKAIFTDATLLNKGDDVRIAGVQVGQVSDVQVYDRNKAQVSFSLRDRDRLPTGVQAYIRFRNLAGQRYLALEQGEPGMGTVATGSTIPSSQTHPPLNLNELFNGFRPLFQQISPDDVNRLSNEIIKVFQGESGNISGLLKDTASLTNTLADKDRVIGSLVTNLNTVLGNLNAHQNQFSSLLDNTSKFVSGLAAQRGSVGSAITSLGNLTEITQSILGPTRGSIKDSIAGLKSLSDVVAQRQDDINDTLNTLPTKLQKVGRLASFGSWFQFYLCGIDVVAGNGKSTVLTKPLVPLPDVRLPVYSNAATRCWAK